MRLVLSFIILALGTLLLAGLLVPGNVVWHQKTVITVETPNGIRQGESVVEVRAKRRSKGLGDFIPFRNPFPLWKISICGNGVVVDLGNDNLLFSLRDDALGGGRASVVSLKSIGETQDEMFIRMPSKLGQSAQLQGRLRPLMVRFQDLSKPISIESVSDENFAQVFGDGFRLLSIKVEVVDEPTSPIRYEQIFPWWSTKSLREIGLIDRENYRGETMVYRRYFSRCNTG